MSKLACGAALLSAIFAVGLALADDGATGNPPSTVSDDGFEPVDPASLDQVSGLGLMISAYAVILGAIVLYSLLLFLRERAALREIRRLERQLDTRPKR